MLGKIMKLKSLFDLMSVHLCGASPMNEECAPVWGLSQLNLSAHLCGASLIYKMSAHLCGASLDTYMSVHLCGASHEDYSWTLLTVKAGR